MDTRTLVIIGVVIVVGVIVVVWQQRQGVVKRDNPASDAASVRSEMVDWMAEKDNASLPINWGKSIGLNEGQVVQINLEIAAGRKIQAIKLYREFTGEGLKEAKDAVEAIERGQRPSAPANFTMPVEEKTGELMAKIDQAIMAGNKIEAIKLYREMTGAGLKEAKDVIDAMS